MLVKQRTEFNKRAESERAIVRKSEEVKTCKCGIVHIGYCMVDKKAGMVVESETAKDIHKQ